MSDQRADYFEYLENVVGIKTILQSASSDQNATGKPVSKTIELLFVVEGYFEYQPEEQDLLSKMIAALKVAPERYVVCDLSQAENYAAQVVVVFQDEPLSKVIPAEFSVRTFSPRLLLKRPELKKQAWVEMQKILPHLS